jgi:phosphate-selective porin OprO and OprP
MARIIESGGLRWFSMLFLGWALAGWCAGALGQEGSPSVPPVDALPTAAVSPTGAQQELLDRLQKMEERLDRMTRQNEELSREVSELRAAGRDQSQDIPSEPDLAPSNASRRGNTASFSQPSAGGGSKTSGGDPTTTGRAQEIGNPHLGKIGIKAYYDFDNDGFGFSTEDEEFTLDIRALSQLDARIYQQRNQFPVSSGFYNPRTRVYFEGRLTKPIQYEFSFQNTFDNVGLLDAYLNFNYDPRFQLRIGRYKTPFTYEWYRIHVWHLLAPERSLFANNYEGNRRFGLMGWGSVFDQRMEYAVGTFNGQRNSYQPFDSLQDVMAFINFKPFYNREEGFLLRDLHVGGSVDAGQENQSTVPAVLRTNSAPAAAGIDSSGAANSATVPFLAFNPGVLERGARALWELHAAYYYGGLTLLGAWQSGYETYAHGETGPAARIPIGGWFAQAGYILTGETIRDRTLVEPLRPFDLRHGRFGLGAWEVTARYSELELSRRVFTSGLADPNLWTNHTQMVDAGFNWYLNKSVKIYFDWEHAIFGNPVVFNTNTGRRSSISDLYWLRLQFYF